MRFAAFALAIVLAAFTATLAGIALPALLLYTKIGRDATLDNPTRRSVFDVVVAQPGLSIQELARRTRISHSTAAYHLDRLTNAGLVVPTGDGNKVRYYHNGGRFTDQERKLLPCLENAETVRVLEAVLRRPNTYRAAVAEDLGVTATTVNWHLRRLFACGVVEELRQGRSALLTVQPGVLAQACAGLSAKTPPSPARDAAVRLLSSLDAAHLRMPASPGLEARLPAEAEFPVAPAYQGGELGHSP